MITLEKAEKIIIIAIVCVFLLMLLSVFQNAVHHYAKEGEKIPQFQIFDLQEKILTNEDFKRQVVLINFWTSWCPPCIKEMPSLVEFYQKYNGKGIAVLIVNVGESIESIEKFMKDSNYNVKVYRDSSGEVAKNFGTFKYPESFLVDKNGIIRKKVIGEINWMEENVVHYLEGLAKEK